MEFYNIHLASKHIIGTCNTIEPLVVLVNMMQYAVAQVPVVTWVTLYMLQTQVAIILDHLLIIINIFFFEISKYPSF